MRVVSYTRFSSCLFNEENPADIIGQQNKRISEYVKQRGWKLSEKYSDRKQEQNAGEAFDELVKDGIGRKFDLLIVDDIFRTGKNIWFAREIMMQTFFPAGIHFAVVSDDFCSIGKTYGEVEAYFAEKVSVFHQETIKRRIIDRHRKGLLCWNDLKYGYQMTDDYQMIIDPETSVVVKRIYEMFLAGARPEEIASVFRSEKILTPLSMRGSKVEIKDPYGWTAAGIKRLLKNEAYTGHWVKRVQGEDFDLYHEPIVTNEEYQKAVAILSANSLPTNRQGNKNKYAGLICEEDGSYGLRYFESKSGEQYFRTLRSVHGILKHISLQEVDTAVQRVLQKEKDHTKRIIGLLEQYGDEELEQRLNADGEKIRILCNTLAITEQRRMQLYITGKTEDDILAGILEEESRIEAEIKEIRDHMKLLKKAYSIENPWIKLYSEMKLEDSSDWNRNTIHTYVDRIIMDVVTIKRIELWNQNWLSEFPEGWR